MLATDIFCGKHPPLHLGCARPIANQMSYLHLRQKTELVDALVSNTSGATRAGSTPALGTNNG